MPTAAVDRPTEDTMSRASLLALLPLLLAIGCAESPVGPSPELTPLVNSSSAATSVIADAEDAASIAAPAGQAFHTSSRQRPRFKNRGEFVGDSDCRTHNGCGSPCSICGRCHTSSCCGFGSGTWLAWGVWPTWGVCAHF